MDDLHSPLTHQTNRTPLFKVCLALSLLLHLAAVFYLSTWPPQTPPTHRSPIRIQLIDRLPVPPQEPVTEPRQQEEKPARYELDPLPQKEKSVPEQPTFRKADRNQQVVKEQAPPGKDDRDQHVEPQQMPALPPQQHLKTAEQKKAPARQQPSSKARTSVQQNPAPLEKGNRPVLPPITAAPAEKTQDSEQSREAIKDRFPQLSPQQLLPDAGILSRIAAGKTGARDKIKERDDVEIGDTVWLNLQNDLLVSFFRRFHDRIERVWNYPLKAAQQGVEGTLELLIIVSKEGELLDVLPQQSSGSDILDMEAIQAVYAAAPFGPLTNHYPHEQLKIRAYFSYRLGGGRYIYGR